MQKNHIREFIDIIIQKAGLDKMPADFLDEYAEKLTEEAQKRMGIAAINELSTEKIEEFNKLIEIDPEASDKINAFLVENIFDFENKMSKALQEFGEAVIERAKKLS